MKTSWQKGSLDAYDNNLIHQIIFLNLLSDRHRLCLSVLKNENNF